MNTRLDAAAIAFMLAHGEARVIISGGENISSLEVPSTVIFGPVPKTTTGKIQKFVVRQRAKIRYGDLVSGEWRFIDMSADTSVAHEPFVLTARADGIATLTLNRPERFNPLSMAMIAAIQAELDVTADDASVRVVVLAARGRGFCAGHDLKEMRAHSGDIAWQRRLFDDCSRMMLTLTRLPQPVIARVHGLATAAGCQMVSMCDLAVAADTATFAMPGVNIGLFCSTPAVGVVRNIGRKRAMEMLLTGAPIDARTACAWGLVNKVVHVDELDRELRHWADIILSRSPAAIRLGKETFYRQIDRTLEAAYDVASDTMACNALLEDAVDGMDAFLQKRPPTWRGH